MGRVHLSFDNGPHRVVTPLVLEVLAKHQLQASFFLLGKHLDTPWGPPLAARIREAGHRLGNHSYSHETPLGEDTRPDAVRRELQRTQELLDPLCLGERLFRPFGGGGVLGTHLLSPAAVDWMRTNEVTCVLWNVVPEDWKDAQGWVEKALVQLDAQEHSLVVLHDILPDAMAHLDTFIERAQQAGHHFVRELPTSCVPMDRGQPGPRLQAYVSKL